MAQIKTYPVVTPTADDKLIGTNGDDDKTKNFLVGAVGDLAIAGHVAASDPHPQYQTEIEGDARYWPLATDLATQIELDAEASARASADSSEASARVSGDSANAAALAVHAALATGAHGGIVPSSRSLTINGIAHDLSADRSWTVGDVLSNGSYADPAWITSLAWSKVSGAPTTLAGYGISDAQPLDSDLSAIALLATTNYGRSLLTLADASAGRTALGLGSAATHADTDFALLGSANTFTLGPNLFRAGGDGNVALSVRRHSSGATGNIQEWQDQAGAAVAAVSPAGVGTFNQLVATDYGIYFPIYLQPTIPAYTPLNLSTTFNKTINQPGLTVDIFNGALVQILDIQNAPTASFIAANGLYVQVVTPTSALYQANQILASQFILDHYSTATNVTPNIGAASYTVNGRGSSAVGTLTGLSISATSVAATSTANYTEITGLNIFSLHRGASGTTTNRYGIRINADTGAGATTNSYQLRIESVLAGAATNKFSIWSNGGQNRFLTGAVATIGLVLQGFTSQSANLQEWWDVNSNVLGSISSIGAALFRPRDAATGTVTTALTIGHASSGTPSAGYGSQILYTLPTNSTPDVSAADDTITWVSATNGSQKARRVRRVFDTAARTTITEEATGGSPMIGFLGAGAVVRQTLAAAASDAATTQTLANSLRTAFINLGLGA